MKKKRLIMIVSMLTVLTLLFTGCASGKYGYDGDYALDPEPGYYYSNDQKAEYYDEESSVAEGAGTGNHQKIVSDDPNGRKLIYTVDITIRTKDYDNDLALILNKLREYGGYIYSESTSGTKPEKDTDSGRETRLTVKIPVENLDSYLSAVEENTNITNREVSVEDTTDIYYDTEHRIELLEDRYKRLEEYLDKVETIEDIITLEAEMNDIIYELDILKGQVKGMDNQIAYSTVMIDLYEIVSIASQPHERANLFERMGNALTVSFRGVIDALSAIMVLLAASVPILGLLLIIAVIIIIIVKICISSSRKRKQKKYNEAVNKNMQYPQNNG